MSFEGYYEFLCDNGHRSRCNVYQDEPGSCYICGAGLAYRSMVDETNGADPDDPISMPAAVRLLSHDDIYRVDHLGNKYATQYARYAPASDRWEAVRKS